MRNAKLTAMILLLVAGITGVIAYAGNSVQAAAPGSSLAVTLTVSSDTTHCVIESNMTWTNTRIGSIEFFWHNHDTDVLLQGSQTWPRQTTNGNLQWLLAVPNNGETWNMHTVFYHNTKLNGKGTARNSVLKPASCSLSS